MILVFLQHCPIPFPQCIVVIGHAYYSFLILWTNLILLIFEGVFIQARKQALFTSIIWIQCHHRNLDCLTRISCGPPLSCRQCIGSSSRWDLKYHLRRASVQDTQSASIPHSVRTRSSDRLLWISFCKCNKDYRLLCTPLHSSVLPWYPSFVPFRVSCTSLTWTYRWALLYYYLINNVALICLLIFSPFHIISMLNLYHNPCRQIIPNFNQK